MMYFVYILKSERTGKTYIGHTNDLERRLAQHNEPSRSSWTAKYQPWKLVAFHEYVSRSEAMKEEGRLKSFKNKIRVQEYIAGWRSGTSSGS